MPFDRPERVEVNRRTGEIYVLGGKEVNLLEKFKSWKDPTPRTRIKLPSFRHPRYTAVMALDSSGEKPLLWIGTPFGRYAGYSLLRIEDKGEGFGKPVDVAAKNTSVGAVTEISVQRQTEILYTAGKGAKGFFLKVEQEEGSPFRYRSSRVQETSQLLEQMGIFITFTAIQMQK